MFLSLVHTARQATGIGRTRSRSPNCLEERAEGEAGKGGLSRNKVAVSEGAAGLPPF